ncbi:hypothetical protein ACU4GD_13450 [Cupriavidus basilensis]
MAHGGLEAVGDDAQDLVADVVAWRRFVDALELVEIEQQERDALPLRNARCSTSSVRAWSWARLGKPVRAS